MLCSVSRVVLVPFLPKARAFVRATAGTFDVVVLRHDVGTRIMTKSTVYGAGGENESSFSHRSGGPCEQLSGADVRGGRQGLTLSPVGRAYPSASSEELTVSRRLGF